jgi:phage protein D
LAQLNQTDLAFVRERAGAVDGEVWFADGALRAAPRTRRNGGEIALAYKTRLLEFSVVADLAHQRTRVVAGGWDVAAKSAVAGEGDESTFQGELGGGVSGVAVLKDKLGERVERLALLTPANDAEGDRLAGSAMRARARRFVTAAGVSDGEPKLRVGATLDLSGLGPLFDGKYTVTLARHTFDRTDGYRTAFEVERPFVGASS